MNLWWRLIRVIIKALWVNGRPPTTDPLRSELHFRVWPSDCDIYFHMTNSRYLALTDLARTYYAGEWGILKRVLGKDGIGLVLQAQEFNFLRPLLPFQKFRLQTRVVWWDQRYIYMEHSYWRGADLFAWGHVRAVVLQHGKRASTDILHPVFNTEPPALSPSLEAWLTLLDRKKDQVH